MKAVSLSYENAPIEIRENVAIEGEDVPNFLIKLKEVFEIEEAFLLSTCNRTEIYYSSNVEIADKVIAFIASFKGISTASISTFFRKLNSREAANHLFRVALGLDSKVLGDIQILNQVKKAYQSSADLDMAGPYLHRMMHTIFYANKRVVQETRLHSGSASVASVAVDLIKHFINNIEAPKIALIGLGEIGRNTFENLNKNNLHITLVNRTRSSAIKLAEKYQADVRDLSELDQVVNEHDVIISAVSAKSQIITKELLAGNLRHKMFIDLSVPRSIDPQLDSLPGILLFNVDDLSEKSKKAKAIREKSIPDVEAIILDSMVGFEEWQSETEVSPTIQKLKESLNQIRKEELARYSKVNDSERKLLEVATKNMIQKLIKIPVIQLKAACKRGEADTLVGVLNDLFDLEKQEIIRK